MSYNSSSNKKGKNRAADMITPMISNEEIFEFQRDQEILNQSLNVRFQNLERSNYDRLIQIKNIFSYLIKD